MTKRLFAILLALTLIFALVACNSGDKGGSSQAPVAPPSESAPAATGGGETRYLDSMIILTEQPVNVLDTQHPAGTGGSNRAIYSMVFDKLLTLLDGKYMPELAKSWDISDDYLTYTFHLRDDVTFSNGDKFTAQDVLNTFELARAAVGTEAFDVWRTVDTLTAPDDYTIVLTQAEVDVDVLFRLNLPWASILNKKAIEADNLEGRWVGTGPYTITGFAAADFTDLARRDDYWGGTPPTKNVTFKWIPEVTARTVMMQNGEAQMNFNTAPEDMDLFLNDKEHFSVITFLANVDNTMMFNMNHPVCGNKDFRLAVAHALSLPEIAMTAGGIWEVPVNDGTVWGAGTEFRKNDLPLFEYNIDMAKEYLAKSPYAGEELELIASSPSNTRAIEMIQEQLGLVGIKTRLYPTDTPTLSTVAVYEDNKAELIHFLNVFDLNASSARNVFYPGRSTNRASYNNPEVTDLLDRAPKVTDEKEREAMYMKVQEIVYEELPYISLYYSTRIIVTPVGIGGMNLNADLNHDFKFVHIAIKD